MELLNTKMKKFRNLRGSSKEIFWKLLKIIINIALDLIIPKYLKQKLKAKNTEHLLFKLNLRDGYSCCADAVIG